MSLHAGSRPGYGGTRAAIFEVLEAHPREELTTCDVARMAGIPFGTAKNTLYQLLREKRLHSRRNPLLFGRPAVWSLFAT